MKVVNMHEAKTHLSRLVEQALAGEPFIIAKGGKPLVRVTALEPEGVSQERFGFMAGQIDVPDDFDRMGAEEIARDFEGD
jgi:prevent-host-death family protein